MKLKTGLMWMSAGLIVGSMYSKNQKEIDRVMNSIEKKATRKVNKMVNNM